MLYICLALSSFVFRTVVSKSLRRYEHRWRFKEGCTSSLRLVARSFFLKKLEFVTGFLHPLWAFSFGLQLKVFKTCLLGRGFHNTLLKGVSFSSPTDVGSHNPPLQGPTSSLALVPFFNQCGTPTNFTLLRGPSVLAGTPPVSTPFGEQPPCWHIARCLALIPFVTAQAHR